MNNTMVKICGLTNIEDARLALDLGADFLGFIFVAESKRFIKPRQAAEITAELPDTALRVGVFRDHSAAFILQTMQTCRLDIAQLHGKEDITFAQQIGLERCWKAFTLSTDDDCTAAIRFPAAAVLIDSAVNGISGGTGIVGDWTLAARVAAARPVVLAGGLNPDNIAEAIAAVRPFAVDVSSGVEHEPRKKDPVRLKQFFDSIRPVRRF